MKQLLHANTWGSIRWAFPNIADGHALAKHYVERCIFLAKRCTRNPTHALWPIREQFERELVGADFVEAWTKDCYECQKRNQGAVEHPSVFPDRLGCTADFNSSDLNLAKMRANRKAFLPVR